MMKFSELFLTECNVVCAVGEKNNLLQGLCRSPKEIMQLDTTLLKERSGYFGMINTQGIPKENNLARTCGLLHYLINQMGDTLERLKTEYQPHRIAVIIGTTTSGIKEVVDQKSVSQVDYYGHQELSAVSEDLMNYCGLQGPNLVVSTACTSGAKALGLARRLIRAGWCDAAVAGASETLSRVTCQGFDSIESYSMDYCKPFQADRDGINIGEGAALFIMEKDKGGIALSGFAESSDAWHESAPEPNGNGPEVAIRGALNDAKIAASDIDYINLHGTGTRLNDAMEAKVMHRIFGNKTPVSSTKSVTGHTLGAAGAIETAILWLLINQSPSVRLPPHHGAENYDPQLPALNLVHVDDHSQHSVTSALSTSFAFGGHNTALVLTRRDH